MFKEYLINLKKTELLTILRDEDTQKHFTLDINFLELFAEDPTLGSSLLTNPDETLKNWNDALLEVQRELSEEGPVKSNVTVRIFKLPNTPELNRTRFPENKDVGLFLQVSGTIVRTTAVKMLEYKRMYLCKKCKYNVTVEASYEQKYIIIPPKFCVNPEFCKGVNLIPYSGLDTNHCRDYQEIKLQEQLSKFEVGSMPNTMWVTLEEDLVDICKPGDSVTICGIVKKRWKPPSAGKRLDIELVMSANHVQVNNDTSSTTLITSELKEQFNAFWQKYKQCPLYGREEILRSFCPQLFGMYVTKLAVATVLAGGSMFHKDQNTGLRTRTEPHLLLVGDPGTGKSQLLRYAAQIIPRSVLTTGVGSTSAGLTVAAVMEDGEWQLEGGALVLADGGICCIDEFNSMKEQDRTSIHEAMEQQTISVAKAGMVCKLSTRCSVLAATNPKGNLDNNEPLTLNVALASPLLSRFDLMIFLKDTIDEDRDTRVADFVLRGYKRKSKFFDDKNNSWSLDMLQAYFLVIKKLNPVLTEAPKRIISTYYQHQRSTVTRNKARTTVRLLDSLVRLSQAHARLMHHKNVEIMDAITSVCLIEASMQGEAAILSLDLDPHEQFPEDSMEEYEKLAKTILQKLNLPDILESELNSIRNHKFDNGNLEIANNEGQSRQNKVEVRAERHETNKKLDVTLSQIGRLNQTNLANEINLNSNTDNEGANIEIGNGSKQVERDIFENINVVEEQFCKSISRIEQNNEGIKSSTNSTKSIKSKIGTTKTLRIQREDAAVKSNKIDVINKMKAKEDNDISPNENKKNFVKNNTKNPATKMKHRNNQLDEAPQNYSELFKKIPSAIHSKELDDILNFEIDELENLEAENPSRDLAESTIVNRNINFENISETNYNKANQNKNVQIETNCVNEINFESAFDNFENNFVCSTQKSENFVKEASTNHNTKATSSKCDSQTIISSKFNEIMPSNLKDFDQRIHVTKTVNNEFTSNGNELNDKITRTRSDTDFNAIKIRQETCHFSALKVNGNNERAKELKVKGLTKRKSSADIFNDDEIDFEDVIPKKVKIIDSAKQSQSVLENPDVSQRTKIKGILGQFAFTKDCKITNKTSFSRSDSGNYTISSQSTNIFECQSEELDDIDLDI